MWVLCGLPACPIEPIRGTHHGLGPGFHHWCWQVGVGGVFGEDYMRIDASHTLEAGCWAPRFSKHFLWEIWWNLRTHAHTDLHPAYECISETQHEFLQLLLDRPGVIKLQRRDKNWQVYTSWKRKVTILAYSRRGFFKLVPHQVCQCLGIIR